MNPPDINTQNIISSPVFQWIMAHWIWVLVGAVLFLVLLFVVIIPGIFSLIRKSKKVSETKELKKDLMVWKNLKALVQGGDKAQNAKKDLSLQLQSIRMMLKQGIALLAQARKKKYDVPWFMILGEPQSGKSELLKNSGLDLHSAANLESSVTAALPLNCWIGPKTFILDVSGRVFFDRWLEGSSAEWDYLIKLIKRQHRRRPLDGILLAIPADALISDDVELTKQKAALIGSELYQLLSRCGMNLPCHVLVTKMDMLLGFREYFSAYTENDRKKIFGWANQTPDGIFNAEEFAAYYRNLVLKLQKGAVPLMLNKELFQQKNSAERMEISGKSYLFADSMAQLHKNLDIYLNQIFGDEGWNCHEQSILSGVYFTAATDNGVVLSPSFAETVGKAVEDVPVISKEQNKNQASFLFELLKNIVFACKIPASFTAKERFKRHLNGYLLCLILIVWGCLLLFAAATQKSLVQEKLQRGTQYYEQLADRFADKSIDKSPLVALNNQGLPELCSAMPMAGYSQYNRLQFFYDAHTRANEEIILPPGFKLSGMLQFGPHPNFSYPQRQYIFNMIQSRMSFLPAVKTFQNIMLSQKKDELFTRNKREAVFDFSEIALSGQPQYRKHISLDAMLLYLFPETNVEMINLLAAHQERFNRDSKDILAQIIYHYDYTKAQQKAFDHFFQEWKKLAIYPETIYPLIRNLIQNSYQYAQNLDKMLALSSADVQNPKALQNAVEYWDKLQAEQVTLQNNIRTLMKKLARYPELSDTTLLGKRSTMPKKLNPVDSLLRKAETDYRKRLKADKREMFSYISKSRMLLSGRGSEVFFKIEQDAADNQFAAIKENLDAEVKKLYDKIHFLQQQKLFAVLKTTPPQEVTAGNSSEKLYYHILMELNKIVSRMPQMEKLTQINDFPVIWRRNNLAVQNIISQLNEVRKRYEKIPALQKTIDTYKKMVLLKSNYNRNRLIAELVRFYPKTDRELLTVVRKLKKTANYSNSLYAISPLLVQEAIGKLNIPMQYEPAAALQLFVPWNEILQFEAAENKNPTAGRLKSRITPEIRTTMQSYIGDYLKFWGTYPDSLTPPFNTWANFRNFCSKMKPYEVNSLLLAIYKSCSENIAAVPVALLSASQKKYRDSLLADITARIQMLTPHFSGVCIRQVNPWSLLPQKPEEAFQFLHARSDKELLSDYLALVATGNKGDIPWWSKFFNQGISLLRREAGQQIFTAFRQTDRSIFRFPLCKDAVRQDEFSENELLAAWKILKVLDKRTAAAVVGAKPKNHFGTLDVSNLLDKRDYEWLDNIMLITDALTNRNKTLLWTLTIPSLEQQKKLNDSFSAHVPLAMFRYRYIAMWSGSRELLKRRKLAVNTVVRGDIIDKNLKFDFYSHSAESQPAGVLNIGGNWPVIRLYLAENSYYEPEKKTLYVPLQIRDRYDAVSVLWVGLTFNQILPLPQNWPSSENWPAFSDLQRSNRLQTMTLMDLVSLIRNSSSAAKLRKALENKKFNKVPVFEIALSSENSKSFMAKYRYAEVLLPGKKRQRMALVPGKVLALCELSTPKITLKFHRFANASDTGTQIEFAGKYAPLQLIMQKNKKPVSKTSFRIPCRIDGENLFFTVTVK